MGGGKLHKVEKAFKPLKDKFDKQTQERSLAAQKAAAQQRAKDQRRAPSAPEEQDSFRKQQQALLSRMTGPKKTGRKMLPLAPASFSLPGSAAAGRSLEASSRAAEATSRTHKYSADRLLAGEKIKAAVAPVSAPMNRFASLEEEEQRTAALQLRPALLSSFVPFSNAGNVGGGEVYSDDDNL